MNSPVLANMTMLSCLKDYIYRYLYIYINIYCIRDCGTSIQFSITFLQDNSIHLEVYESA